MKMDTVTAMRIGLASPFLVERWMRLHEDEDPWKRHRDRKNILGALLIPAVLWSLVEWSQYDPDIGLFGKLTALQVMMVVSMGVILIFWLWIHHKNTRAEQKFVKACEYLQQITGPYHQKKVGLLGEAELADAARRYLVHLAKNKLLIERNDGPMREEEEKRHGLIFKEAWNFLYYKFVLVENGFESYYDEAERQLQAVLKDAPQIVGSPADPAATAAN